MSVTLVIDPGHGGRADPGAMGNGVTESHKVLQMAMAAQYEMLKKDPDCRVVLTRGMDAKPTFQQRAQRAREVYADLVISLHINASVNPQAHGFWVFHQHNNVWSKQLATYAAQNVPTHFKDAPVRIWDSRNDPKVSGDEWLQRPENVLKNYGTTALLLEWGFLSNVNDAKYLKSAQPQKDFTELLIKIVKEYRQLAKVN